MDLGWKQDNTREYYRRLEGVRKLISDVPLAFTGAKVLTGITTNLGKGIVRGSIKRASILIDNILPDAHDIFKSPYVFAGVNIGEHGFSKNVGTLRLPEQAIAKKSTILLNEGHGGTGSGSQKINLNNNNSVYNKDFGLDAESTPIDINKRKVEDIVGGHKANKQTLHAQYGPLQEFHNLGPAYEKAIEHLSTLPGFEDIKDPIKGRKFIQYPKGLETQGYVLGNGKYEIRINKAKPGADYASQKVDYVMIKDNQVLIDKHGNYIKKKDNVGIYLEDRSTGKKTFITDARGNFLEEQYKHLPAADKIINTPHAHIPLEEYMKMKDLWKK